MILRKDRLRVLIAAGGTGGHLIPAIEVARQIESHAAVPAGRLRIEIVGVGRPVEERILANEKYVAHVIPVVGVRGRGFKGIFQFLRLLPKAFLETYRLLKSFKPDVVAGFGGYPSVLPVLIASFMGIPTWIHEADSAAAWTSRFLSLFVSRVSSGFEDIKLPFGIKATYTGHPVRDLSIAAHLPDFDYTPARILILGGSQGSRSLDAIMPAAIKSLNRSDLQILHQARPEQVDQVRESYRQHSLDAQVVPFISDMKEAYAFADIVVCRSGAGTVTEIIAANRPAILVPLPKVSGPQLHNARVLEKADKAVVVEEGENFQLRLEDALAHIMQPDIYRRIIARQFSGKKDAAQVIADGIVKLALASE